MKEEKLIKLITESSSAATDSKVHKWISQNDEYRQDYIQYKNLWALLQTGNEMSARQIKEGLLKIKKHRLKEKPALPMINYLKYAAIVLIAVLCGYFINEINFNTESKNTIYVSNGSRSSIVLPDGSKVWLSNGTKFIYPEKFSGGKREVELEGEGFFDVSKNKRKPFIVKIGENRIRVLGTKFAIVAYPEDNFVKADLISGQIQFDIKEEDRDDRFHSYLMKPSQSLVFNKDSKKLLESNVSDNFYDYWINGVYEFKDETFERLAKRIERIYNIKLIFKDELLKKRYFTGSLSIDDNIYTMMEAFRRASSESFEYYSQGNQIIIVNKK
ncbi:FecR family protein [Sunxiuqinia sp. A32]|uniref:FecR family protein n=1 Tax=Sunxiuqinia sp. A32 TaxID=3461496 RepID=UPI004045810D